MIEARIRLSHARQMVSLKTTNHQREQNGRGAEGFDDPQAGQTSQLYRCEQMNSLQRYLQQL